MPRFSVSRWLPGLITTVVLSIGFSATPTMAHAASSGAATAESAFLADLNAARSAAGLPPYAVSADLVGVARAHSARMAATQDLYHNPNLTTDVTNWRAVGENVGEGPTEPDVHSAFMHSPEHRANILDNDFTQVGIGVTIDGNGIVWVTEDFRQPMPETATPLLVKPSPRRHPAKPHARAPARHHTAPREHVRSVDPVSQTFAYATFMWELNARRTIRP